MADQKIILIDDEETMVALLKIELESEGFAVSMAYNGQDGLDLVEKTHPDLVLLDAMMPDLSGYEVLKQIRENPATKDIAVIMLTAKGLDADIQKGLDCGADDYITKPFHPKLLLNRIRSTLINRLKH